MIFPEVSVRFAGNESLVPLMSKGSSAASNCSWRTFVVIVRWDWLTSPSDRTRTADAQAHHEDQEC